MPAEHSTASDTSVAAAEAAAAAAAEAESAKQEADSMRQEAYRARIKATQKADEAEAEALNHQRDAKSKADIAEEKAKELSKLARMAHISDKFDADSRAFRDIAMSTMLAADITAEDVVADPAQALQDATAALGGVGMVTAAINAAANIFPRMPATWFPVCGGGTGQATRTTRPASQPPAGPAAPLDNRRRRRTGDDAN